MGLLCEPIPGRGEVPSVDKGPVSMVRDIVLFKEDKDLAALFISDLGDIKYSGSGVVCEMGRAVVWWAKLSNKTMGKGLPGAKVRG
jgi:hypothetical protein